MAMPSIDTAHAFLGVDALYTPAGSSGGPLACTVIDCGKPPAPAVGVLGMSAGTEIDLRKMISVKTSEVPASAAGDTVEVALDSRGSRTWTVTLVDDTRPDEFRLVVV